MVAQSRLTATGGQARTVRGARWAPRSRVAPGAPTPRRARAAAARRVPARPPRWPPARTAAQLTRHPMHLLSEFPLARLAGCQFDLNPRQLGLARGQVLLSQREVLPRLGQLLLQPVDTPLLDVSLAAVVLGLPGCS